MNNNVISFPATSKPPRVENYFGGCPECGDCTVVLNVGGNHWFVCERHQTKWCVGYNLFSSWREETQDLWERNAVQLSEMREVEPLRCNVTDDPAPEPGSSISVTVLHNTRTDSYLVRLDPIPEGYKADVEFWKHGQARSYVDRLSTQFQVSRWDFKVGQFGDDWKPLNLDLDGMVRRLIDDKRGPQPPSAA